MVVQKINMSLSCILAVALITSTQASAFNKRLDDISVAREPTKSPGYGGGGGVAFDDLPFEDNYIVGIHSINISFGDYVDAIQVMYLKSDGSLYLAPVRGNIGDLPINITLNSTNEYVSKIEGKIYNNSKSLVAFVGQLTITISGPEYFHKVYGPFGRIGTQKFSYEGYIFGFHGRSGNGIVSIGFYSLEFLNKSKDYGGHGGNLFDDLEGVASSVTAITSIHIWHAEVIGAFQVEYLLLEDIPFVGKVHGMISNNTRLTTIRFDEGEKLTGIKGQTGDNFVDQLTLNMVKEGDVPVQYGPFGETGKHPFEILGSNILGFFGSSGKMIDRLGVYYIP